MSTEPTDHDPATDPDADPEMLSSGSGGAGGPIVHGTDGVRESAPASQDPDAQDDPDADPGQLASSS